MADQPHVHTNSCWEMLLACGKSEHEHGSRCYDKDNNLVCTHSTHSHTGSCDRKYLTCPK